MLHYLVSCADENLSRARIAHELSVSRHISDPLRAADILAHEMVHAAFEDHVRPWLEQAGPFRATLFLRPVG